MAVARSTENIPALVETPLGLACSLCEREMPDTKECLSTKCNHTFHKKCINDWLQSSQECPNCKKLCHNKDLIVPGTKIVEKSKTSYRGRGRGSTVKRYGTRGNTLANEESNVQEVDLSSNIRPMDFSPQTQSQNDNISAVNLNETQRSEQNQSQNSTFRSTRRRNINRRNLVNYDQISQMINSSIQQALLNLNIHSVPQQTHVNQPNVLQNGFQNSSQNLQQNVNYPSISDNFQLNPGKVTTTIQSWNVRFDGSMKGLRCEEFIYRITCLTRENFNGNFNHICRNLHVLLTGKAKEWYWRYHKSVESIEWEAFCLAFRWQYKDYRTSFDIREELHSRKQKPNESFEAFYDAVHEILDQLPSPMADQEIIEIISRNLRPEIRHELLYVDIYSLAELKKLCLKREKLLSEDSFKRNINFRALPQRKIAAINIDNTQNDFQNNSENDQEIEMSINALNKITDKIPICWNCGSEGHFWDMCLKERNIFCYGCGMKNVYKPQCTHCSKNVKTQRGFTNPRQ